MQDMYVIENTINPNNRTSFLSKHIPNHPIQIILYSWVDKWFSLFGTENSVQYYSGIGARHIAFFKLNQPKIKIKNK